MRRLLTIIYIIFCLELGIFLFILPWTSLWSKNYFTDHFPLVSGISHNYFLRGAVSGLGLADIWLAVYEIWRLLHPPSPSDSRSVK
jgi:hypothetical protein